MKLEWEDGTLAWCRDCGCERPHDATGTWANKLRCRVCGWCQHPANVVVRWSVDDKRDPAQSLPPERAWGPERIRKGGEL